MTRIMQGSFFVFGLLDVYVVINMAFFDGHEGIVIACCAVPQCFRADSVVAGRQIDHTAVGKRNVAQVVIIGTGKGGVIGLPHAVSGVDNVNHPVKYNTHLAKPSNIVE